VSAGSWREHLAGIRPDADPAEADWWDTDWRSRTPAAIGFLIPSGFEAYARVLHPAGDAEWRHVRWSQVAAETGSTLHPEAQWWRLARRTGAYDQHAGWLGNDPVNGCLPRSDFEALTDVLARHTTRPDGSLVAFWVGYGVWPPAWHDVPTTKRPVRESYLFRCPVEDVPTLCAEVPAVAYAMGTPTGTGVRFMSDGTTRTPTPDEQFEAWAPHQWQTPSAWWPADHAWATSNDTDLDSTLVGGPRALVDELLADDRLEVLPWPVDGSLWSGADTINR
jgi:hypothetical protein